MESLKLLAISGSLRSASYNTAAIKALQVLAPAEISIAIAKIDTLPLFNPDREHEAIPALAELKSQIQESSGLILASPEYAHGVSGPLKNALDWLVSGIEFPYKPIMLINTSPRAFHALASLKEILTTMSGNIIESAFVSLPLLGSDLDCPSILENDKMSQTLKAGLDEFCQQIQTQGN